MEWVYYGCDFIAMAVKLWLILHIFSCLYDPKAEVWVERVVQGSAIIVLSGLNAYNNSLGIGLFSNIVIVFWAIIIGIIGKSLYHIHIFQAWYGSFVFLVLTALIDFFILALFCAVFQKTGVRIDLLLTVGWCRSIYLLVFSVFLIIIMGEILKRIKKKKQLWKRYLKKRTIFSACIAIGLGGSMIYFQRIYKLLFSPTYMLWMIIFIMSAVLVGILIIANQIQKKVEEKEIAQEWKLKLMEKKYQEMRIAQKEKEKLLHDTKNHMKAIQLLAEKKDTQEILHYIEKFYEKAEKNEWCEWTGNTMLDLILNNKICMAKQEKIQLKVTCDKLTDLNLSSLEICTLFANLLDNAIEANKKQEEGRERWIHLICRRQGYMLGITIINPVKETFDSDNGFPDTSKEDKTWHGIGLYSIQSVMEEHDGNMRFWAENGIFKQVLNFTAFTQVE